MSILQLVQQIDGVLLTASAFVISVIMEVFATTTMENVCACLDLGETTVR